MKISTVQQKRTPQGRREFQQNNQKRSHTDHKRKQNQENPVKQQKTNQQTNITSPLKESTKENQQKIETVVTSKLPQHKAATSKSADSIPPTLPTTNSPQPSSYALFLFAEEFSEDELPHCIFQKIFFHPLSRSILIHPLSLKLFLVPYPRIQMLPILQLLYQVQHQSIIWHHST